MLKLPVQFMKATLNLKWERGYLVPHDDSVILIDKKGRKHLPNRVWCVMPVHRDVNVGRNSFIQHAANEGYAVYEIDLEDESHPLRIVLTGSV